MVRTIGSMKQVSLKLMHFKDASVEVDRTASGRLFKVWAQHFPSIHQNEFYSYEFKF